MSDPNFTTGTIWTGDCLDIMRGMNSETVDLIYLDPPFNSNANYAAPVGSQAAGAAFKDTWTLSDVDAEWINLIERRHPAVHRVLLAAMTDSDKSYLAYMAARLLEMPRLLKPTGSIYLHCDPTMSHYLKLLMDAIFEGGFRNEIIWAYRRWPSKQQNFQRMHDVVLRYARGEAVTWNQLYEPLADSTLRQWGENKQDAVFGESGQRLRSSTTAAKSAGAPMRDVWDISIIAPRARELPDAETGRAPRPHHPRQHQRGRHGA